MQVLTIGGPAPWPAPPHEGARAQLTTNFLQIILCMDRHSRREVQTFQNAQVQYGVFEAGPGLSFVLTDIGGIKFDTSLNMRRPGSAEAQELALLWPEQKGTLITYVLTDLRSNKVLAWRMVDADTRFAEAVRFGATQQLQIYTADAEVNAALARAEGIPLAAMLSRTVMYQRKV